MAFRQVSNRKNNTALVYHDLFDYPLTDEELAHWETPIRCRKKYITLEKNGFFYLRGRSKIVNQRIQRQRYAKQKLVIAKRATGLLQNIPSILFIGLTGSLSMNNTKKGSDIDFLIITKANTLWLTRLIAYLLLYIAKFKVRKSGERSERDKLCLNMWMDERDLIIAKENLYTAHELAQIVPLVNKNNTHEKLINKNRWLYDYWPRAAGKVKENRIQRIRKQKFSLLSLFENLAYRVQMRHMRGKVSREVITPTRAFFHPFDWGEKVLKELQKRGVKINQFEAKKG